MGERKACGNQPGVMDNRDMKYPFSKVKKMEARQDGINAGIKCGELDGEMENKMERKRDSTAKDKFCTK
jgi:hypothetical protein